LVVGGRGFSRVNESGLKKQSVGVLWCSLKFVALISIVAVVVQLLLFASGVWILGLLFAPLLPILVRFRWPSRHKSSAGIGRYYA